MSDFSPSLLTLSGNCALDRERISKPGGVASTKGSPNNQEDKKMLSDPPYIDLREAPFSVVANDSSPAVVTQNTAGINLAIATHSGTGASLVLPNGDIFVEEQTQTPGGVVIRWCIKFGTGVSKLILSGQGMFATTLVQLCVGDGRELNLLNIDGASYIELVNLGFRQDRITNPDPGQQNHMVAVYNNTLGGTTKHIRGHNLFFGKCIGDAIRILAGDPSDHVVDAKFSNFFMVLNGVVTSDPPNGRTGARSGIAIQRGGIDCEFGNFYIVGAQNSAIDEEPSGGASVRTYFHDFQIDNTSGNTGTPVSLGGSGGGDIAHDGRIHDGYIQGGNLTMLGPTSGYKLERLTIETTAPPKSGATVESLLLIRSGSGGHTDLELNDITIKRTGTSADGNCLDIINTGNRTTIRNLHVVQGVAGSPVAIDGATHLNLEGYRLQYDGAGPASRHGVRVQAVSSDADDIRISDVNIVSSTGKLQAAVHLDQRHPRSMARIKISDVRSAGSASHGVYMSFDLIGGTPDRTPEISGIVNGSDPVWTQTDQNDNPITTAFPIISGNRGDICTFVGEATPEGSVTAIQGCMCIRKNGDTTELLFKQTTTGNTGWVQITVP
jgi:hypothetical protein